MISPRRLIPSHWSRWKKLAVGALVIGALSAWRWISSPTSSPAGRENLKEDSGEIFPSHARAYWISPRLLVWSIEAPEGARVRLHCSEDGTLQPTAGGIEGGTSFSLQPSARLAGDDAQRFPFLAGARTFFLEAMPDDQIRRLLRGQLAVSLSGSSGSLVSATGIQIAGVIDRLFGYDGSLGVSFDSGVPTLKLWAPTARSVRLLLYSNPGDAEPRLRVPLLVDPATGVWSVIGDPEWNRDFYLYEVEVYVPETGKVELNRVTDPYSVSLSADSRRSQIVNLDDPDLAPPGWHELVKPPLKAPEDIVIYELHVRDFSISDETVPAELRGSFAAFAAESDGTRHLRQIADAGLTHVHLLPAFDFATVPERREEQLSVEVDLASFPPNSAAQQEAIEAVKDSDGFNWGYDPLHYSVPEGSYSTDPDGPRRIPEFRRMVQALNQMGLRVVLDVVYNHTHASGQNPRSILDRIVPGYYHRRGPEGNVLDSTCCANTATEHRMMEKLMIDSLMTWVRAYRVDGFRFDLMGHHLRENLVKIRRRLDDLTPAEDGVDGAAIYLYGEGWDFGEMENNARGVNATQLNLAGTGIGTFNDRLRDAVRGGTPFAGYRQQGFITGLATDPNGTDQGDERAQLRLITDWIRLGLAGNLADFRLVNHQGRTVTGREIDYTGRPAGYTDDPQENIVYVEAHDNETLFDVIQIKAPRSVPMPERVRMQNLGLSLVGLSQGVPFFHAGTELLRSKSMDRDSFNSGDWFNRLDFSYQSNNWGVGLPPAEKNREHWPLMAHLLGDPALEPESADIRRSLDHFLEILKLRRSSPLFRLRSAAQVREHLRFHNTGPDQVSGLVVMSLSDPNGRIDPNLAGIVVLFNARPQTVEFPNPLPISIQLHPLQAESSDPRLRQARFDPETNRMTAPGRTTAVFVGER